MKLSEALRIDSLTRLALVGAGGKTAALFQIARQLSPPVLVTATTHLAVHQLDLADRYFIITSAGDFKDLDEDTLTGVTLFTGPIQEDNRTAGLVGASLQILYEIGQRRGLPLLLEADGSRQRPLKAPAPHEPAIPDFIDTVIVAAGLSALGQPLTEEHVHRPELFGSLADLQPGETIATGSLGQVLLHPQGGLKGIPESACRVALLNQVNSPELERQAHLLAESLLPAYSMAAAADLSSTEPGEQVLWTKVPTAGIILAAGGSRRYGEVKQLLPWRGEPLVRRASRLALEAGLSPVIVVTGCRADEVSASLHGLSVHTAHNQDWEAGQSTSLSAGLKSLPSETGAALFILADQPRMTSHLLKALVDLHAKTAARIVAPRVGDKRANPVLFDRAVFPDLLKLEGDVGGRVFFSQGSPYQAAWLDWEDRGLLLDIDTPEDYQELLDMEAQS